MNRILILALLVAVSGCTQVARVITDPAYDIESRAGGDTTTGLDYRDFNYAAKQAVDSFLSSPRSKKPNSADPWIMAVGRITNDTTLSIDTDQLVQKIRVALQDSGLIRISNAITAGGTGEELIFGTRNLDPDLFDVSDQPTQGTILVPELSLSGKIIQNVNTVGSEQQIDYYFQLRVTDLRDGLSHWEFEEIIAKLTDDSFFIW